MAGTPRTRSPAGDAAFASASASASATERSPLLADAQQRKARSMPVLGAPATNNDADEATRTISGTTTPHGTPQSRQEVAIASLPERLSRAALIAQKREQPEDDKTQWQILSVKARYYIPVLQWLPQYSLKKFAGDVIAALTMTSVIAPQAMSYATSLVHANPVSGLFGAAVPAMIYSVLGTCRQLSVGPEAALSLLTGDTVAKFLEEEEHAHGKMSEVDKAKFIAGVVTLITFQSGLVTFILGFFRLGFLDAVLSRALLRGFMTAVAVTIFAAQLVPILGLDAGLAAEYGPSSTFDEKVRYLATHLGDAHRLTLLISVAALVVLVSMRVLKKMVASKGGAWRAFKYIPQVLLVVVVSTVCSHVFRWNHAGVAVLGHVSAGSVKVQLPAWGWGDGRKYATKTLGVSTLIAVLGFLDSIASKYDYPISPNRELCALGFANLCNSLCSGSLMGYGSITRSRLAATTGATTQMTSLLTGTFVLLVTYFLLQFLSALPKCILATIVCVVVFSILEEAPEDVMFFWKMGAWTDGALMLLTFFLSLFVSVEVGITVSVALSMILCIKHSTAMRIKILGRVPGTATFEPLDEDETDDGLLAALGEEVPGVLIVRIRDVALTFANTGPMKERLRRLERYGHGRHHPAEEPRRAEASVVIFDLSDVNEVDASALVILLEIVEAYSLRSVLVFWTQCHQKVLARLREAGVIEKSGGDHYVQPTVAAALEQLHETMQNANHGVPEIV
ncbi:hypothetical protein C6P46_003039 [Rhodotorula mucilaginosa]|uniref:STAS domain-containing protein n=1 Tax=Rhodotorula mucilaginosa TaxID=5537 RepID=A0A9P6W3U5_RHOMI|nr:hypothetical protein C6P46_003039 [Rhodotorula mucilaginosa]TKA53101.1 hypothetical protein B0A53_03981 [Rhodotorula sp. CCFEE 5036]